MLYEPRQGDREVRGSFSTEGSHSAEYDKHIGRNKLDVFFFQF